MARVSREQFGARARLDDCRRAGADAGAELFVVEGESAAASVVRVRDAGFQAVLPMQGKPLNSLRASREKVLAHLMFFHRWMPQLIESGRVELVRPPWGEVMAAGRVHRALSDPELTALADRFRDRGPVTVRRYRGLAAIDADVIRDTCVAPATRRVTRVSPADVATMIEFLTGLGSFCRFSYSRMRRNARGRSRSQTPLPGRIGSVLLPA